MSSSPATAPKPVPTMDPVTGKLSDGSKYFDRPPILAHALAMFTLFGLVLPAAAFYARYYRSSSPRWMPIHAGIQTFAGLCVILAAIPVMTNPIVCVKPHRWFGYALLGLIVIQMLGGFAHFRTLVSSSPPPKGIARNGKMHAVCGVLILLIGFAQIPQGIHHDFSFSEQPWAPMYLVYYALIIIWLTLVAIKEVANMQSKASPFGNNTSSSSSAPLIDLAGGPDSAAAAYTGADPSRATTTHFNTAPRHSLAPNPNLRSSLASSMTLADQTAHDAINMAKQANLRQLTWPEFDQYVTHGGKQWVVGPGGVVFDISTWITSHPGGQQVLFDAIGSNITTDYFNAEMFDQHKFKAFASRPSYVPDGFGGGRRATATAAAAGAGDSLTTHSSSIATTRPSFLGGFQDGIIPTSAALALADRRVTQADWEHVVASRRTHVHSRTAIAKLAGMAVAWVPESGRRFDKHEYRRYALTHKVDLSTNSRGAQVHQLTFTLLYPNESYPEEPSFFLPGHSVELRMRLPRHLQARAGGAAYVTRFYTPLSGNMTHFTIALKLRPNGLMSTLLGQLSVAAHRQIHIRGPFGTPLMNPARPLPLGNGCYDHTLFLTVGTGVTPALQTLAFYFAQTYFEQVAHIAHPGTGPNELKVQVRDKVLIKYPLANGWVWATNTTTVTDGYVPLRCLVPWVGRAARMTVVAAERDVDGVIGRDMLELCRDGYPDQVQVHYRVQNAPRSPAPANLSVGKIDQAYVMHILHTSGYLARMHQPGAQLKIGVCGPQAFLDQCYEWLTEVVPEEHVWLLPVGTYLTLQGHQPLVAPDEYRAPAPVKDQFRPLSVVSPTAASVPNTPLGGGFRDHLDIGTLALPLSPTTHQVSSGNGNDAQDDNRDDDDDGTLFLPGLPVHKDPGSNQSEWFYLPPETAARAVHTQARGASVGPPGTGMPEMVEIVVSEPGVAVVQEKRGSAFIRTR
ncbi:hypothetical protein BCR44DRAFT_60863 [Catenaria anguillulae PL171]|uniref:Cytochrome b5 heme-binding domain-containing protein n=1 Tax=Catenaria anguillulae PL171 TaxID=765915 RepID=A0A1Y2H7Z4_9FUNG|nr:hypothetical protein BCR44DRAFT_60863 [Catenaria anguillulae PL171]